MWASSQSATGPNGCETNTAGTLAGSSAQYTASYAYDTLGRLTSGPAGSAYTYGDGTHLHAATSTSGGYTASYDASGNMLCRAPTSATTCSGTPTGAQLGYDNEGRLVSWQHAPSGPTTTVSDAYDGEGQRVAQRVTVSGTTTTTYYLAGGLAEQSQPSGTLTNYYSVPGVCSAVSVGSTLSYLTTDGLGSVTTALSSSTVSVTAQQLYGPYGSVRYASGSMPTAKGYTGQYADAATGLDYYHARYYDPVAQQFVSADTLLPGKGYDPWGLSRYAYVEGNPETATDPTGHRQDNGDNGSGPDPSTTRHNYADDYYQWYWWDQNAGTGKFYNLDTTPRGSTGKDSHLEVADGVVLARYFGLSVYRVPTQGSDPTADYIVAVDFGTVKNFGPLGADYVGPRYQTAVDLYAPTTSQWEPYSKKDPVGSGIIGNIYKKGQKRASIIAVDISKIDPNGQLSPEQPAAYGQQAVYWPYGGKPSQVMRVIFIRNGQVVEDYNPTLKIQTVQGYQMFPPEGGWGPPAAKYMPRICAC